MSSMAAAQHRRPKHPTTLVSITKIMNVYPKHPPTMQPPPTACSSSINNNNQILTLSNLDRQCPDLINLVFFYKPSSPQKMSSSVFSSLRAGLEETLSVWYPAAGRLVMNPTHNDGAGKLDICCNNAGALLVEAVVQKKMAEFGDDLSQYNEFFENLVYKPLVKDTISEMPLVVAQVTKFSCGGYSVGVGTSHSLFDGPATFNFLSAWASNSSINNANNNNNNNVVLTRSSVVGWEKPVHDRGRLLIMNNNYQGTRVAAIEHLYHLITQGLNISSSDNTGLVKEQKYVLKTFHVTSSMIDTLKRKVYGHVSGSSSSCSSFEILAAHLWKARSRALGLMSTKKDRLVCLQFSVDTRNRMVPPLPQYFSGNAYVLASVALTAGQLEEASYEFIIEKIKEAKLSITNDYVGAYIKTLEASKQTTLPPIKELTLVSDWTRMPLHRINLIPDGGAGAVACPLNPPIPQVSYFIQNSRDNKGVDLRIGLSPQTLNAFTHYFLRAFHQY